MIQFRHEARHCLVCKKLLNIFELSQLHFEETQLVCGSHVPAWTMPRLEPASGCLTRGGGGVIPGLVPMVPIMAGSSMSSHTWKPCPKLVARAHTSNF